jgi:hypothetical protein
VAFVCLEVIQCHVEGRVIIPEKAKAKREYSKEANVFEACDAQSVEGDWIDVENLPHRYSCRRVDDNEVLEQEHTGKLARLFCTSDKDEESRASSRVMVEYGQAVCTCGGAAGSPSYTGTRERPFK